MYVVTSSKFKASLNNFLGEDFVFKIPPEKVPRVFIYLQRVPTLRGFWDFKKTVLRKSALVGLKEVEVGNWDSDICINGGTPV